MSTNVGEDTIYKIAFDAWKFQAEQFWSRSSYYVVFQLAFGAGIWKVFDSKHFYTSSLLSLGAFIFTIIWVLNTERTIEHIRYAWHGLKILETTLEIPQEQRFFSNAGVWLEEHRSLPGDYRTYARITPPIFAAAWIWLFVWSIASLVK